MLVSVIVPTYNGAHKLPALLSALQKQTYKEFELIVAVDGSTDNTDDVLKTHASLFKSFVIVAQANNGRAAVRNFGAKQAKGDLLIFFDDDMLPEPSCIEVHVDHHSKYSSSILTGAQIDFVHRKKDIQIFKSFLSTKWMKKLDTGMPLEKENLFITAANFSIPRKLFEDLNGFDEQLNDAEDFDLAVRAYIAGIPLNFNKLALAWHNDPISCASYIKRTRQYAGAHKRLVTLKPWMAEKEYIKPVEQPLGWRRKIFKFFASSFWITAVDKETLKFLPKPMRYKIYDLVITANGVYFAIR